MFQNYIIEPQKYSNCYQLTNKEIINVCQGVIAIIQSKYNFQIPFLFSQLLCQLYKQLISIFYLLLIPIYHQNDTTNLQICFILLQKYNKMIRYISEREIDPKEEDQSDIKYSSEEMNLVKSRLSQVMPQQDNSSKALKNLKRVNDYQWMMKGRLLVLKTQDEKLENQTLKNQQRYQFYQRMRQQMSREKEQKRRHLNHVLQQIRESTNQARINRHLHAQNLKYKQQQLNNSRINDYQSGKEQQREIDSKLNQFRTNERERKNKSKMQIRQYQQYQRDHLMQFMQNRKKQLKLNQSIQSNKINQIKQEKTREINSLSKLEEIMLERQSRSRISSHSSQIKLQQLLHQGKTASTSHSNKLPYIEDRKRSHDIIILF